VSMVNRSGIGLAVMTPGYKSQTSRILKECTANDSEAHEFQDSLWYVFDPSRASCQAAIATEQKAIDDAAAGLSDAQTQIPKQELDRWYVPTTVSLGADKTNKGQSWPEYDRLYRGGVQPNKLVIGMVNGFNDHGANDNFFDSGYRQWLEQLRESFRSRPT